MKRLRTEIATYARKRARTMAVAVVKKVGRSIKRRIKSRVSNTRAARAFNSLTGGTRKLSDNSSRRYGTVAAWFTNSIGSNEVTNITQGTGPTERENNSILLKGIAINYMFINNTITKLYLNFAMVTPKQGDLGNENFFRSNDINTNENFLSNPDVLPAIAKHTRAINADKYIIHFHKRCILGSRGASATGAFDTNSSSTKRYKMYYKLNQKVTYSTPGIPSTEQADQKIYLIYWCNVVGAVPPIIGGSSLQIEYDMNVIFKGE